MPPGMPHLLTMLSTIAEESKPDNRRSLCNTHPSHFLRRGEGVKLQCFDVQRSQRCSFQSLFLFRGRAPVDSIGFPVKRSPSDQSVLQKNRHFFDSENYATTATCESNNTTRSQQLPTSPPKSLPSSQIAPVPV